MRIITYNINGGAGPAFPSPRSSAAEARRRVEEIGQKLSGFSPDIVALQEVDFDSDRSGRIDQEKILAAALGLPYVRRDEHWTSPYLPWPRLLPPRSYGRMRSGLLLFSRYPIRAGEVHRLPPVPLPFYYRPFYPDRIVQLLRLETDQGEILLYHTHLEADQAAARVSQAGFLSRLVRARERRRVILVGDLNAEPSGAEETLALLREALGLKDPLPLAAERKTLSYPAEAPVQQIDYILATPALFPREAEVLEIGPLSDHLPVVVTLGPSPAHKNLPQRR